VEDNYVMVKPIGANGLRSELHAIGTNEMMARHYAKELTRIIRDIYAEKLSSINLL
jgi:LysR family transcriptional regulator for metE and metH